MKSIHHAAAPEPRRVRIVGSLDMVRASNKSFSLKMKSGERIRCVLRKGRITDLALVLSQAILVFGTAMYRVDGTVLRIEVDDYRPAVATDSFFAKIPFAAPKRQTFTAKSRKKMADGLKSIIGTWPGDETDEQVDQALQEIS